MQCVKCNYPLRQGYVFCPFCGAPQVDIRLAVPEQIFLGNPFVSKAEVSGCLPVVLEQVLFSGDDLGFKPRKLAADDAFKLQIDTIPIFCDLNLEFRFKGYPTLKKKITAIDAASLEFSVQNLYKVKPFVSGQKKECIISFSVYDDFSMQLTCLEQWALDSTYHIVFKKKSLQAKRRDRNLIWGSEAMLELLGVKSEWNDTKFECEFCIRTQDGTEIKVPFALEFNLVPKFELLNMLEIVSSREFRLDTPDKPVKPFVAKIGINIVPNAKFNAQGTNFRNFRVRSEDPFIRTDNKPRYQKEEDCQVRVDVTPSDIVPNKAKEIKANQMFEFELCLDIEPQKSIGKSLSKRFKLGLPASAFTGWSDFAVIDFGTTNSCVIDDQGKMVSSEDGSFEHKSLIHFNKLKTPVTDSECSFKIDRTENSGLNVASNFKSMLIDKAGQVYPFKDDYDTNKVLTPIELTTIYLKHLTNLLAHSNGKKPKEVVLTYPAIFSKQNREHLFNIVRTLGFEVVEDNCISEPEAIAFFYLSENEQIRAKARADRKVTIAVLDCGGGTTDYSVVEYNFTNGQPEINVVASWGSNQFAGTYLTFALAKCGKYRSEFPDEFQEVFEHTQLAKNYREKFNYLEREKIKFANRMEVTRQSNNITKLLNKLNDKDEEEKNVDYGRYAPLFLAKQNDTAVSDVDILTIEAQFQQIQDVLDLLYADGELEIPSVDYLVLAGNSCRMPLFKHFAEKQFPGIVIYDPRTIKTAVAKGAYFFRSRADATVFKGLKRSKESFVIAGHLDDDPQIYKQWLSMEKDNFFESDWYPGTWTKPIVVFRVRAEAKDKLSQRVRAFELKIPDAAFVRIKFELNYRDFRIIQRWIMEDQDGNTRETDWQTVYNHE